MTDIRGGAPLRAFEGLRRWRHQGKMIAKRRKAIAELDALDDRTLQDIGVNRRSIRELVEAQLRPKAETGAETDAAEPRPAPARPRRPALRPAVLG